jgi:hypothetical protein
MHFIRDAAALFVSATIGSAVLSGPLSHASARPAAPSETHRDGEIEARRKALDLQKLELETRKIKSEIDIQDSRKALDLQKLDLETQKIKNEIDVQDSRKALDLQKLELETRKIKNEIDIWWLTPVLTAASILLAGAGVAWQTRNANNSRRQEAKAEATLKLAEFVLSSRHPAMARNRVALLERIDKESFGSDIISKLGLDDPKVPFPAVARSELQVEVFKQLASNPQNTEKIKKAFSEIFPRETWIYSDAPEQSGSSSASTLP